MKDTRSAVILAALSNITQDDVKAMTPEERQRLIDEIMRVYQLTEIERVRADQHPER